LIYPRYFFARYKQISIDLSPIRFARYKQISIDLSRYFLHATSKYLLIWAWH